MPIQGLRPILLLWSGAILAAQRPAIVAEHLATFRLSGGATMAMAFSPDGRLLATAGELGDLMLRDVAKQRVRWRVRPSDHWVGTLAFAPDGTKLACLGRHLTLHDVGSGAELWRQPDTGPTGFAWNADGTRIAFRRGNTVVVRDLAAGAVIERHRLPSPVNALCFDPGGACLCAGDNVGDLWRVPFGAGEPVRLRRLQDDANGTVRYLTVAHAGGILFQLASTGALRRGDADLPVPGHPFAFAVNGDGTAFAVGGSLGIVRWWTGGGDAERDVQLGAPIAALAFTTDGGTLCASTYDGRLELLRADAAPVVLPGHEDQIRDIALSPDGSVVAMLGDHCVLQPVDGSPPRTLPAAAHVTAGRRGAELLVAGHDDCRILDGHTGAVIAEARGVSGVVGHAVLGPGNRVVDGLDEMIDLATGARTGLPHDLHLPWNRTTTRSPAGTWAVAGSSGIEGESGSLVVTDAEGALLLHVTGGPMPAVAFSPDGSRLVYACSDPGHACGGGTNHRLRVLNGRTLQLEHEFRREVWWLFCLDARRALIRDDRGLALLDTDTGDELQRLPEVGTGWFDLAEDCRTLACTDHSDVRVYRLTLR